MTRNDRKKGFFVSFDYSSDAVTESSTIKTPAIPTVTLALTKT